MAKKRGRPTKAVVAERASGGHVTPRRAVQISDPWGGVLERIAQQTGRLLSTEVAMAIYQRAVHLELTDLPPPPFRVEESTS